MSPSRPRMKPQYLRKERRRVAQRDYRNRRENTLQAANARAKKLQAALDQSMKCFGAFHDYVVKRPGDHLPPDVISRLAATSMEMASIVRQAYCSDVDEIGDLPKGDDFDSLPLKEKELIDNNFSYQSKPAPDNTSHLSIINAVKPCASNPRGEALLMRRLLDAYVQRAVDIFQHCMPNGHMQSSIPRSMELYKVSDGSRDAYISSSARSYYQSAWKDINYSKAIQKCLPRLFRIVEGNTNVIAPRSAPPYIQKLQFAKTRTVVDTNDANLKGEWLEASDVVEYLAERGIYLRRDGQDVLELTVSPNPPSGFANAQNALQGHLETHQTAGASTTSSNILRSADGQGVLPLSQDISMAEILKNLEGKDDFQLGMFDFNSSPEQSAALVDSFSNDEHCEHEHIHAGALKLQVNLDTLFRVLSDHAICLGPSPGIRRVAVDLAIRQAVLPASPTMVSC
ncbi:hypothetical protein B0I35DRAFT_267578 [Stachybotrys elegans]|uniref:BZIP domain-containing protein n=1 Tax=Stachybotrys elegans TaxID=80388 RepID=A0A8K0SQQ4_9HYPO|nr:hypothetical protein B0I35DRAFT_267578 [Stachybotrys elegans]